MWEALLESPGPGPARPRRFPRRWHGGSTLRITLHPPVALLGACLPALLSAQDPPLVLRTETRGVQINAGVKDGNGLPIRGLHQEGLLGFTLPSRIGMEDSIS